MSGHNITSVHTDYETAAVSYLVWSTGPKR